MKGELLGRLRSLRPHRPAPVRVANNGMLPAVAWHHLIAGPESGWVTGTRWKRGWQLGRPVVNGHLEQLVDDLVVSDQKSEDQKSEDQEPEDQEPEHTASEDEAFDVVLAVNPESRVLAAAAESTTPDAVILAEFHLHRWESVAGVRRKLERAGLLVDELYSVSPSDDWRQSTYWLPTSQRGPTLSLLESLAASRHKARTRRVLGRSLQALTRTRPDVLCNRPWLLFPTRSWVVLAVAATTGGFRSSAAHGSATADGAQLRLLRLGGSSTDQPIVTHHDPEHHRPSAVTKLPSRQDEVTELETEMFNLRLLADRAPGLAGVPRIVAGSSDRTAPVFLTQSYMTGVPLNSQLGPGNYAHWLTAVGDWASALAEATSGRGRPLSETTGRWLDDLAAATIDGTDGLDPLHEADGAARAGATAGIDDVRDLIRRSRLALDHVDLDLRVMQHRDFGPWNIHGEGNRVGVIDWATANPSGLPLCDLVHYATHAAVIVTGGYERADLARAHGATVDPETELGRSVARTTADYCTRLGIDRSAASALRLANWIGCVLRRSTQDRLTGIYRQLWELELVALEAAAGPVPASSK